MQSNAAPVVRLPAQAYFPMVGGNTVPRHTLLFHCCHLSSEGRGDKHTRQETAHDPPAWPWQTNESHGMCRCQDVGNEAARRSSRTPGFRVLPCPGAWC
jgi:hypothetical protein